jgi:mono/diheme cytochrome c family protein
MWLRRILIAVLLLVGFGVLAFLALAWRPEIAAAPATNANRFSGELIKHGAQLAAVGNCANCHSGEIGRSYAGGRAMPTPFGTIHATNITPDRDTGIGTWSEEAFQRAMREGLDRRGRHLYPVFPYDHFTRMTDDDVRAVYAFLMTREPVRAETPANNLSFPYNIRMALAGWKLLYLHKGPLEPDPSQGNDWNRGRYLSEGVAHCGACHTPRNSLGAEKRDATYAGGDSGGWHAPALNAQSPAPVPWDADHLFAYLREGWDGLHGASAGPMREVTDNLRQVPEQDVRAIAVYVASIAGKPSPERQQKGEALVARLERGEPAAPGRSAGGEGAPIFAGACQICHTEGRAVGPSGAVNLALSSVLRFDDPRNTIHAVLHGIQPTEGERGPIMPPFEATLTDRQIADVVSYARARFTDLPAWNNLEEQVRRLRTGKGES